MTIKLIDRQSRRVALRHFSTVALFMSTAITGAYVALPESLQAELPGKWVAGIIFALSVWGAIGKFIAQPEKPPRRRKTP